MKQILHGYYCPNEFDIEFEINKLFVANLHNKLEELRNKYKKLLENKENEKSILERNINTYIESCNLKNPVHNKLLSEE